MLHICMISPGVLPVPATRGGAIETLIMSLVRQNEREGCLDLTVVSVYDAEACKLARQYKRTKFIFINPRDGISERFFHYGQALWKRINHNTHIITSMYYRDVLKNIRAYKFDAVIFEGGESLGFTAYDKLFHGKLWYHVHANPICKTRSAFFTHVIILSDFVRKNWAKYCTDQSQQLHTIHNGINTALFGDTSLFERETVRMKIGFTDEDFILMYCGRISSEKGVDQILKAVKLVNNPHIKVMIIGKPNTVKGERYLAELISMAEELNDQVKFIGYVPNDELSRYYAAADVQIVPSLWEEGAGNVCIEGMASGMALIVSNCGGIPEYVSPDCAILVNRGESMPNDLAQAIITLFNNPSLRVKMGEAGRQRASMFSESAYYRRYVKLLEKYLQ